jgi:hypothetical protein
MESAHLDHPDFTVECRIAWVVVIDDPSLLDDLAESEDTSRRPERYLIRPVGEPASTQRNPLRKALDLTFCDSTDRRITHGYIAYTSIRQ